MSEELALIDWAAITLIAFFGITGFFNGFIKELFSAAAWIVSLALSWLYGPLLFPYVQEFISQSPLVIQASSDSKGNCDASPKGGMPGFVKVLDDSQVWLSAWWQD